MSHRDTIVNVIDNRIVYHTILTGAFFLVPHIKFNMKNGSKYFNFFLYFFTLLLTNLELYSFQTDVFSVDVYFAQTHVQKPTDDFFKLISDRSVLIKVQVSSLTQNKAPIVNVVLSFNNNSTTIILEGADILSPALDLGMGVVQHRFSDSYTALIPAIWIKPGLKLTLNVGGQVYLFNNLMIGAPNKIVMNMFDIHFFSLSSGNYANGWKEELEEKLPTSGIELRRVPNILFKELSMHPRGSTKAVRVTSRANYATMTGIPFDGEQDIASYWTNALKFAAGRNYNNISLFYTNIFGVPAGGQGSSSGYSGVGTGTNTGILSHELGHCMSLPHWGDFASYPYKGILYGISPQSTAYKGTHVGPTWGYDSKKNLFIPPTVQNNSIGGEKDRYKNDPMQGGGSGDQETGFILRHFSDYSVNIMKNFLEGRLVIWNPDISAYASWNTTTKSYSTIKTNNGIQYPLNRNTYVISIMASVCSTEPQANIVYPPIGPYISGLIKLFDPTVAADRASAVSLGYCPTGGCDLSVKVIQNNVEKTYMLAQNVDKTKLATDPASFTTSAINLDALGGKVSKIELLNSPDAQINGLPIIPEVLYSYNESQTLGVNDDIQPTFQVYFNSKSSNLVISGLNKGKYSLKIFDLSGKKLADTSFEALEFNEIPVPKLSSQIYIVHLIYGQKMFSKKIIVE